MRIRVDDENYQPNERIDRFLSDVIEDVSRSKIAKALDQGDILCNGQKVKKRTLVEFGDLIEWDEDLFEVKEILPEEGPLKILYEDDYFAVIYKERGLIVHPTEVIREGTLVNRLLYHFDHLSDYNGPERPGIVHRLDKDTTGLLLVAKTNQAHIALQKLFQDRKIRKFYLALVDGELLEDGLIEAPIGRNESNRKKNCVREDGKEAKTAYHVLAHTEEASYLEVRIFTGRTHQIRVHMDYIGHPVLGDPLYGNFVKCRRKIPYLLLHAHRLEFTHPFTGEEMHFETSPPQEFDSMREKLKLM